MFLARDIKPRILFVDPFFGALGGGVMVSCWIAEALGPITDFTWLSWRGLEFDRLNRFAGTRLGPEKINQMAANRLVRGLGETINAVDRDPYSFQRWSMLMRIAKMRARDYDLVIGCNDEMDFGRPGIQYIHFPYLRAAMELKDGQLALKPSYKYRPWRVVSGFDPGSFATNLTLVNSDWTGRYVQENYRIPTTTLYPPVPGQFEQRPWGARDNTAICVGRIGQDKRLERIVEIVSKVRAHDPDFRLRIAGVPYSGPGGAEGIAFAREAAAKHDWVDLHLDLPRDALCDLISRSRIGIHAKEDEHFGIAVAEMVRAGSVVFVHDSGGQVEIVGGDRRLIYTDVEDAASKVSAVLMDEALRADVLGGLSVQSQALTTDAFCDRMRAIVADALAEQAA